jgi:hypothetical protein
MPELTPQQIAVLERLRAQGFQLVQFAPHERAIGVRKGNCAALLQPTGAGSLQPVGDPSYLVDGNLSVRLQREGKQWFVWKAKQEEATPERRAELAAFAEELKGLLQAGTGA